MRERKRETAEGSRGQRAGAPSAEPQAGADGPSRLRAGGDRAVSATYELPLPKLF